MNHFFDFDVHIFDCDGVILDSNQFKLTAMSRALQICIPSITLQTLNLCADYFKENFGRSRFHHVDLFLEKFILIENDQQAEHVRECVLSEYAIFCDEGYRRAEVVRGFSEVVVKLKSDKFVASGTEEQQLKRALKSRNLQSLFVDIFGAPRSKADILSMIKEKYLTRTKIAVIGDSLVDLDAAVANGLYFFGFLPLSNTPEKLKRRCLQYGFQTIDDWSELVQRA
jgi:phosphoglycolate phosphatase-like HAD superfamily hydrolase